MAELDTTGMVKKYYQMDPETDEFLLNGSLLRTGMTVLLEDPNKRVDLRYSDRLSDWEANRALECNRWATVSYVGLFRNDVGDLCVGFVATYEDGSQRHRRYHYNHSWLVKKESIPADDEGKAYLQAFVAREIIREAALSTWPEHTQGSEFDQYCTNAAQRVIELLASKR